MLGVVWFASFSSYGVNGGDFLLNVPAQTHSFFIFFIYYFFLKNPLIWTID